MHEVAHLGLALLEREDESRRQEQVFEQMKLAFLTTGRATPAEIWPERFTETERKESADNARTSTVDVGGTQETFEWVDSADIGGEAGFDAIMAAMQANRSVTVRESDEEVKTETPWAIEPDDPDWT